MVEKSHYMKNQRKVARMSKANEEWKALKPQIGQFVNTLDVLYRGAEDIDEAITRAEARGYKKGFADGKKECCENCLADDFAKKCNGHYSIIEKFLSLDYMGFCVVSHMINALTEKECGKND